MFSLQYVTVFVQYGFLSVFTVPELAHNSIDDEVHVGLSYKY